MMELTESQFLLIGRMIAWSVPVCQSIHKVDIRLPLIIVIHTSSSKITLPAYSYKAWIMLLLGPRGCSPHNDAERTRFFFFRLQWRNRVAYKEVSGWNLTTWQHKARL